MAPVGLKIILCTAVFQHCFLLPQSDPCSDFQMTNPVDDTSLGFRQCYYLKRTEAQRRCLKIFSLTVSIFLPDCGEYNE